MILSKVLGPCVATLKHPVYIGKKVLVVEPVDLIGYRSKGTSFLAIDSVQAGPGDIVLVAREGNAARQILGDNTAPVHSIIAALVDHVDHEHAGII